MSRSKDIAIQSFCQKVKTFAHTLTFNKVNNLKMFFFFADSDVDDELEDEVNNITKKKKQELYKLPEERKLQEARQARIAVSYTRISSKKESINSYDEGVRE